MKYLRLPVVVLILLGLGYGLWQFAGPAPTETPEKPPMAKAAPAPEIVAKATTIEPPKVVAPVVAPPKAAPTPVVAAAQPAVTTASKFDLKNPQPQADVNDCVEQSLLLLQAKDVLGLVKTLLPPQELQRMIQSGQVASAEDAAVMYSSRPEIQQMMMQLQTVMESAKGETPEMNNDGTIATYKVDSPPGGRGGPGNDGSLQFIKVDGLWYLR